MFISSVVLYLTIRKSQIQKVPIETYSLAMFAIPAAVYFIIIILSGGAFSISVSNLTGIIFAAIFFSFLGNWFSQKAITLSPNPGYSLVISKSYVVMTTIFAVIFLHSALSLKNALAIILIVFFSALISIDTGKKKKSHGYLWFLLSIGAFFTWGFLALFSKYILDQGMDVFSYLFYLTVFASVCIAFEALMKKAKLEIDRKNAVPLILIGISSVAFNFYMQTGYKLSPNPGYINAVNVSSITLVTVLSHFFFRDELNIRKIVGIIGVTLGLFLLFL